MSPVTCHINALLANTDSNDQFNQVTVNRLKPEVEDVIKNSKMNVQSALFIYYASSEEDCVSNLLPNIQQLFGEIHVECITPGMEAEQIDHAECLVIGGGSIDKLSTRLAPFASNLWTRVLSGVPFVGINNGGKFLSSVFLQLPNNSCSQFTYFPIQYVSGYSETPQGETDIRNLLYNNMELQYALCMPTNQEGGGIVLEDAKTGLAGSNTDWGGGPPPGTIQELYIYERDGAGGIRQVAWTDAQRKSLPINIM